MRVRAELFALTGPGAFQRGVACARQGLAVVTAHDRAAGTVRGRCRGSRPRPYDVDVTYRTSVNAVVTRFAGRCSCPVGVNCKHAVALLLTALDEDAWEPGGDAAGAGDAGDDGALVSLADAWGGRATPPSSSGRPATRPWRSVLAASFPQDAAEPLRLALEVDLTPPRRPGERVAPTDRVRAARFRVADHATQGHLRVRPLSMGRRGRWIVSAATWPKVLGGAVEGADPVLLGLLSQLHSLAAAAGHHTSSSSPWLSLDGAVGPAMWPVLSRIVAGGADLVRADTHEPAHLEASSFRPEVCLVEDEDHDVHVRAGLSPALPTGASRPVLIGSPAHGLAWTDAHGIHLAQFLPAATRPWLRLRATRPEVVVPAGERRDFEREFLPRIRAVGWSSPDGSFTPGPPPAPTLCLEVDPQSDLPRPVPTGHAGSVGLGAAPVVRLHWTWRRRWGGSGGDQSVPIDRGGPSAVPEGPGEVALLAAAAAILGEVGAPLAPAGRRPRQDALVRGMAVVALVEDVVPRLEAAGVAVTVRDLPEWHDAGAPVVHVGVGERGADWFDLDVEVGVGGTPVPLAALISALTRGDEALYLSDGTYARLDDPGLDDLRRLLAEARDLADPRRTALRVPRSRISWWEDLLGLDVVDARADAWFDAVRLAASSTPSPAPLPRGLDAELRPYQRRGFEWLARLRRSGLGGVLADDMGLGKTVQVLAMVLDEREHPDPAHTGPRPPWLVVAPTSVVGNWVAETRRFAPGLAVVAIEATGKRRGVALVDAVRGADVVVTSYALARLEEEEYAGLDVAGLVLDEAQNAKNAASRTFAALAGIGAPVVYAVSGTPMENHLGELWSMFALTAPGLLGPATQFRKNWRRPIEAGEDEGGERLALLRRRIAPFLLRRTKSDVALDLPPKQEQVIEVELNPAHRRVYDRRLQRERQEVLHLVGDLERNQVEVLAALTRLRQLAIDPGLVEEGTSAHSSKLEALVPLLADAADEGHRVLVFSQFTRFLRRIAARLDEVGIAYAYLDGTTPRRAEVIRGFAQGEDPVFLISLKAGGVGVNLAMADYAVLVDPWWNPATEEQAVDRAHRIGQTRPVHVYRLVSTGTIEEKVLALQDRKRELAAGVLAQDVADLGATGTEGAGGAGPRGGAGGPRVVGGAALSAEDLQVLLG